MDQAEAQQREQAPDQQGKPGRHALEPVVLDGKADPEEQREKGKSLEVDGDLKEGIDRPVDAAGRRDTEELCKD